MSFRFRFYSFLLLCSGFFTTLTAQVGWEAGGWVGVANYFGDLNTDFRLDKIGPAGGAVARYNFNNRVCLKFSGNYSRLAADDADSDNVFEQARNLSFRADVLDFSSQFEFNFLPYNHGSRDEFFTPYLALGFNVVNFTPEAELDGVWYELQQLGTEGQFSGDEYSSTVAGFLVGGGMKVDLSYRWSLNFEFMLKTPFTDYLDDVSTVYGDVDEIENLRGPVAAALSDRSILIEGVNDGQIGRPGRQRGDSTKSDTYVNLGVGLVYYFGELRCPEYGSRKRR